MTFQQLGVMLSKTLDMGSHYDNMRIRGEEMTTTLPKHKCRHCGHEWVGRVDKPRECPNCKRYDWQGDKDNAAN